MSLEELSKRIARRVLIDYTKEEMLTPEQANLLKECIMESVSIFVTQYNSDDLIP